jgi:hypothetical protein
MEAVFNNSFNGSSDATGRGSEATEVVVVIAMDERIDSLVCFIFMNLMLW